MNRLRLLPLLLLVISGCTNDYSKFYKDFTGGKNVLEDSRFVIPTVEPKLRQGFDPHNDAKDMLENGYCQIGESCFNANAGSVRENAAVKQAKIVHADTVIVYNHYTHNASGIRPVPTSSYNSGTIYGSGGGFASYSGYTYGTSYVPYSVARYDYLAAYWVKLKPMRLGIYFDDLTDELRKKVGSNKGIYITIVVKDSPAFNSDLLTGDVIRRVNGTEVIDKKHFSDWLKGETNYSLAEIEIFRNDETISKKVQLRCSDTATVAGPTGGQPQPTTTVPKVSADKTPKEAPVENLGRFSSKIEKCSICGKTIPKLEQHFMVNEKILCKECFTKDKSQKPVAKN